MRALLARLDRRLLDDAALGRDAVDLILLEHTLAGLPTEAWRKVEVAYGPSVERAWVRGLERLREDPARRGRWLDATGVVDEARVVIETKLATSGPSGGRT